MSIVYDHRAADISLAYSSKIENEAVRKPSRDRTR